MQPWTSSPKYINLVNFLIEKTKDAKPPLQINTLAREFKENSQSHLTISDLNFRIRSLRPKIHEMDDIDTATKVKLLYALSVPINNYFLEYLQTRAEVVLDDHRRIIKYKKYGGGLELKGTHVIIYEESDAVKKNRRMIELFAQKSIEVDCPITVREFLKEFKEATEATESITGFNRRFTIFKSGIHEITGLDQATKIRMLFVSSASVPNSFLCTLRQDALVEVDHQNRITKYRANDGSLMLQGEHTRSAKIRTGQIENSQSYWTQINNYYQKKDAKNGEMGRLIEFITEKCKSVYSPLSAGQLAKDFNKLSGISTELARSYNRIRGYCHVIQNLDVLDTPTKVRQLFGLGGTLNEDFLEKLRKEAVVEVDHRNRIINYNANDGSLILMGCHRRPGKPRPVCCEKGNKKSVEALADEEGLNEYLKIEFDSESYNDNDLDETEESTELSTEPINHRHSFENCKKSGNGTTGSGKMSKKRKLDVSPSPPKQSSSGKRAPISNLNSDGPRLDDCQMPEVKLEPFRGTLIDDFTSINSDDDIKAIPPPEFCEPKKEIEEEPIKIEIMEFPIKTEENFITPKQEELEEEDIKPELLC